MDEPFTLIVRFVAKPGLEEELKQELFQMIKPTREEDGCRMYIPYQDDEQPQNFFMYEQWETKAHHRTHCETPHLKALIEKLDVLTEAFSVHEVTPLERL